MKKPFNVLFLACLLICVTSCNSETDNSNNELSKVEDITFDQLLSDFEKDDSFWKSNLANVSSRGSVNLDDTTGLPYVKVFVDLSGEDGEQFDFDQFKTV